jgi:hypothetical protein
MVEPFTARERLDRPAEGAASRRAFLRAAGTTKRSAPRRASGTTHHEGGKQKGRRT